jgi:hypothetical protein
MWVYQLPVHHSRAEVVVVAVPRPEVEEVGAEVEAEVLHRPEVAGAAGAVGAAEVQGQDRSLGEEEVVVVVVVQREALFFLAEEMEAVQV